MFRKTLFLMSGLICFVMLLQIVVEAAKPTVNTLTYGTSGSGPLLRGEVYSDGGQAIVTQGFIYGKSSAVLDSTYLYEGIKQLKEVYSGSVAGLLPNTTYYYKAFATNADGETYGGVKTFTTGIGVPSVTAVTYANTTSSGVDLTSGVTNDGGAPVTSRGFLYSTTDLTPTETSLTDGTPKKDVPGGVGPITETLSGLQPITTYYVWSYAKNSEGVTFSPKLQFTTLPELPVVTTGAALEITSAGAKWSGEVTSDGGGAIIERGFLYSTTDLTPTSANLTDGTPKLTSMGSVGPMSETISSLQPGTQYNVWSYAKNAAGVVFGGKIQFTTLAALPTVTTGATTEVTGAGAKWSGEVTSDGGGAITERGFLYSTTDLTPTDANLTGGTPKLISTGSVGPMSETVSGLQPGTQYYVWSYAKNAAGAAFGSKVQFTTLAVAPTVTTGAVSEITSAGAKYSGEVTSDGGGAIDERGFLYSTTDLTPTAANLADGTPKLISTGGAGPMSETVSGLQPGTQYYVWSYAKNAAGAAFGNKVQFTTLPELPTIMTNAASEVTGAGAKWSGEVTSDGGGAITERGFLYSTTDLTPTDANLTDGTPKLISAGSVGLMSEMVSGLQPGTQYYVWSYAKNAAGAAFGSKVQFTTLAVAPIVNTGAASEITSTGAKYSGEVTSDGGGAIDERGFLYSTTDLTPTAANLTDGTPKLISTGGAGPMSETVSGLQPGTQYYVWSYAKNTAGAAFGNKVQFTTLPELPTITTNAASEVTGAGAKWSGEVTSDGGGAITERGFLYSTTDLTPTDANLTDGTLKLISTGSVGPMSETVSGLQPGTQYYVWSYAKNAAGVKFGGKVQFTTLAVMPSISTGSVTEVTGVAAKWSGEVTSNGGGVIDERGFLYSTTDLMPTAANLTDGTPKLISTGGVGPMSETVSGLQPSTQYYVWSYAKNAAGVAFGGKEQFTTLAIVKPTVLSGTATSITTSEATVSGEITSDGWGPITERGIVYALHAEPTVNDYISASDALGSGQFSKSLSGLTANTQYYARAYAINAAGVSYGTVIEFMTLQEPESSSSSGSVADSPSASKEVQVVTTDPRTGSATNQSFTELIGGNLAFSSGLLREDGTPVSGSNISISPNGAVSFSTVPPPGEYNLELYVVAPTGDKLAGTTAKLIVDKDGHAELDIELIDPYGTITDSVTGKPVDGVDVKLYWAETELNKAKGRVAGQSVALPELPDFAPNQNHNPQISKNGGQYGWMVFPDGDYYMIGEKNGYVAFDSRKDMRNEQFGKDSYIKDGIIHVGATIVKFDFSIDPIRFNHNAYMQGYEDGTFRPNGNLTRGELAAVLTRVLSTSTSAATSVTVTDMESHWAADDIRKAIAQGWMSGYPDGTFAPDQLLTRAELAQVLWNVKHLNPSSASSFDDVTGHWGMQAIGAVEQEGWISGYPDGKFLPDQAVTRAEAVTVFNKLLGRQTHTIVPEQTWPDVPATFWAYPDIMEASLDH